ncbi:hypothetical protein DFH28DRAFT_927176 [Melampsora americana]|nr:hypothetical protein DFH28DRAFT_927176 [Melampsora americana]
MLDDEDNTRIFSLLDDDINEDLAKCHSDDDTPLAKCNDIKESKTKTSTLIAAGKLKKLKTEKSSLISAKKPKRKAVEKKRKRATRAKRTSSEVRAIMEKAEEEGAKLHIEPPSKRIKINASEDLSKEVTEEVNVGTKSVTKKKNNKLKGWKGWAMVEEEEDVGPVVEDEALVKGSSSQDTMGIRKRRTSKRNKGKMAQVEFYDAPLQGFFTTFIHREILVVKVYNTSKMCTFTIIMFHGVQSPEKIDRKNHYLGI